MMGEAESIKKGKKLQGIVISNNGGNSVKVKVEIKKSHPIYGRVVKSHKNYLVHNEINDIEIGDNVIISESKPFSKTKKFLLVKKVSKS
jgi:small subunit ribosomal protein S17